MTRTSVFCSAGAARLVTIGCSKAPAANSAPLRTFSRLTLKVLLAFLPLYIVTCAAQAPQTGIGILFEPVVEGARITLVLPGMPAERAGLRIGDVIMAIDNQPIPNLELRAIRAMILGPEGTAMQLTVMSRDGKGRNLKVVRSMAIPDSPPGQSAGTANGDTPGPMTAEGQGTAKTQVEVRFDNWEEPKEHSFTVDVPRGWQVTGGVNWTGPIDAQQFIRVQSADGKVLIFIGDPEILPRQILNQWSSLQTGVGDGGVFQSPSGGPAMLQRFLTGSQYAKWHVMWRRPCQSPRWVNEGELPELARSLTQTLEPQAQKYNANLTISAGEAGFICDGRQGYLFAATSRGTARNNPEMGGWGVLKLAGFVTSDPMQSMQARYIMEHMMATMKMNAEWEQAYEELIRRKMGMVISMQDAAHEVQRNAAKSASNDLARLNHPNQGVNVRPGDTRPIGGNGNMHVCDGLGRCATVSNTSGPVYIDHSDNVRTGRAGGAPPDNSGVWTPLLPNP